MMIRFTFILLVIGVLNLWNSERLRAQNIYKKLSVTQCDSLILANAENPNFVILDVRTPGSWSSDHLLGSINRNFYDGDFAQQLDALPKHKVFLIHCQSGGRSGSAFNTMKNLGFAEVYDMIGGINSWKSNAKPTTSELGPKLMLVGIDERINTNAASDTIHITLTNRANQLLTFSSVSLNDVHAVAHNFQLDKSVDGAEDYTFSIIHTPGYMENDSTKISIVSNGGVLDFNVLFKEGVVGKNDFEIPHKLVLYPNPAKEYITIDAHGLNLQQISITDLSGKLVFKSSQPKNYSSINIDGFENGIYLVRMDTEQQSFVRKIIVQHE